MKNSVKVIDDFGVKNQYVIATGEGVIFQSYDSIIAEIRAGVLIYVGYDWNKSKTTGKYRNLFFKKYESCLADSKKLEKFISENMEYSNKEQGYIHKDYKFLFEK